MARAILQARMSSSRLPGKVLADLVGAPMVLRQIKRLARCRRLQGLTVAIPGDPRDDGLAATLNEAGVSTYRGSLHDVLARFAGAMRAAGSLETIVRLTADCPLTDPTIVDATIDFFHVSDADYVSNTGDHRTFPSALMSRSSVPPPLLEAEHEADAPYDREHVTPFIYRRPDRFRIATLQQAPDEGAVRWTVDRPDDLAFVREVYGALYEIDPAFTSQHIRQFMASRPELMAFGGNRRL